MKAYVFPGQGAQFSGMGLDLYNQSDIAKELFDSANSILGFKITETMFNGSSEELKQTKVTQPAIFLHSVILAEVMGDYFKPEMVAGHSLGEYSAVVAAGKLDFATAVNLVRRRGEAMQEAVPAGVGAMTAVVNCDAPDLEQRCVAASNEADGAGDSKPSSKLPSFCLGLSSAALAFSFFSNARGFSGRVCCTSSCSNSHVSSKDLNSSL